MDGTLQGKLVELTEVAYKNKSGSYWKMIIENGDRKNTINSDVKPDLNIGDRGSFNYRETAYVGADGKDYKSKWMTTSFSPASQTSQPTNDGAEPVWVKRLEEKIDRVIQYIGPDGML